MNIKLRILDFLIFLLIIHLTEVIKLSVTYSGTDAYYSGTQ